MVWLSTVHNLKTLLFHIHVTIIKFLHCVHLGISMPFLALKIQMILLVLGILLVLSFPYLVFNFPGFPYISSLYMWFCGSWISAQDEADSASFITSFHMGHVSTDIGNINWFLSNSLHKSNHLWKRQFKLFLIFHVPKWPLNQSAMLSYLIAVVNMEHQVSSYFWGQHTW